MLKTTNQLEKDSTLSINLEKTGYSKIYNFFLDEVMKKISKSEFVVLMALNRFLVGYQKEEDFISIKTLSEYTNISKNIVSSSLEALENYNIISITKSFFGGFLHNKIKLNLDFNSYKIPTQKEKLTQKVSNFFKKQPATKEVFQAERITINSTVSKNGTVEKTDTIPKNECQLSLKMGQSTVSKNGTSKDINNKENINTHVHVGECNADLEIDLILKDQLIEFGFNEQYAISTIKKYTAPVIWRVISYLKEEINLHGKTFRSFGGMITTLLKHPEKMIDKTFEKKTQPGQQEKTELKTSKEKNFSSENFKKLQKIAMKYGSPVTDSDDLALANSLTKIKTKDFIIEVKNNFSMDDLVLFFNDVRANKFFGQFNNISNKDILAFWEVFESPELLKTEKINVKEEVKALKERLLNLPQSIERSINNAYKNLGLNLDNEAIPL